MMHICRLTALVFAASTLLFASPSLAEHAVRVLNPVTLQLPDEDRTLTLRIALPEGDAPAPVIVFSHGANSSKDLYDLIADHWAAQGYAVLSPTHIDSESLALGLGPADGPRILAARVRDVAFLLTHADEVAAVAGVEGRLDVRRKVVAGHSFGALIAMAVAGVPLLDPASGERRDVTVPGVSAVITLHGVGDIAALAPEGWQRVSVPVFAAGGTHDPGLTGDGIQRPWRWRMGAFDLTNAQPRYALSLTEGDHYLGGLIGRLSAPGPADHEGLAAIQQLSSLFLAAVIRDDADARAKLDDPALPASITPRARLERR